MPYICVENPGETAGPVGRRFVWYEEHDQDSWREAVGRALQTISGGHEALTIRRNRSGNTAPDGMTPEWCIAPSTPFPAAESAA